MLGYKLRVFLYLVIRQLRPTVHTNRHENKAFKKRSSNRRNLKILARVVFACTEPHFDNGAFWKRWPRDKPVISLPEVLFYQNQP